jgi:dienelactone hydrolase
MSRRIFHTALFVVGGTLLGLSVTRSVAQTAPKNPLIYSSYSGKSVAVKNASEWATRRLEILKGIQKVTGPLPSGTAKRPAPAVTFKDTLSHPVFVRYRIHLTSGPGEFVPAFLYIPNGLKKGDKAPAMVALHGTGAKGKLLVDSLTANPNQSLATELAYRGYVVIAPDYPSFGELSKHNFAEDRFESGMAQATFNNMCCIDYLQSRNDVAPGSIGAIGHSLGGHTAMFLGALDERVKIVVSSCGWTPFEYYDAGKQVTERYGSKLGAWAQDRYMPHVRDKFQSNPSLLPFNFDELIATLAPRHFFSNSPINDSNFDVEGVRIGEKSARKVYELLGVSDRMEVHYPEAAHDFPVEVRNLAYQKIDQVLKK